VKLDPLKLPTEEPRSKRAPRDSEEQKTERKKSWREPEGFVNGARVKKRA
jgi:hypothetical protein